MFSNLPSEYADTSFAQIRETIARLQKPIQDVQHLLPLLAAPLHCLGLLSPRFEVYNTSPLDVSISNVLKYIPALQRALLEHVIPTWEANLVEGRIFDIIDQYFCPDSFSFASPAAGEVALQAYSVLLSVPLADYVVRLLTYLAKAYPIDVLREAVFSRGSRAASARGSVTWEDCVRNVGAVPAKVANALGARGVSVPVELEHGVYFNNVSIRSERMILSLAQTRSRDGIISLSYLFSKLVTIGAFPPTVPSSPSQPSFFQATLPYIRLHAKSPGYSETWNELLGHMSSTLVLNSVLSSFVAHLKPVRDLDPSNRPRSVVLSQASLLQGVFGRPTRDRGDLWDAIRAVMLGREWTIGHARIFVCWIAGIGDVQRDSKALETMLKHIVNLWATPEHIRHSLLRHHQYVTGFLLLVLSYLPSSVEVPGAVNDLALSSSFVTAVSSYLGHLDPSVRRCGMLVAEEVARGAGKNLDFGDWDGNSDGREWCRDIRKLVTSLDSTVHFAVDSDDEAEEIPEDVAPAPETPVPKSAPSGQKIKIETQYDSDDSLTGYASSPASSRSPSPTPSELEEIEKDPTLRVGHKKIMPPVYLAQLGEMIRPTGGLKSENEEEVTKIEVALTAAEELVRRKRQYGTELEENAVNLVYAFVGLQDNFNLEGFARKRQATLNALVACCPRKAAPAMIEEFFKNQYSTDQRFAILNALALGARELANLPVPGSPGLQVDALQRISFPSKRLPLAVHEKYATLGDDPAPHQHVRNLLEGISKLAIDKAKEEAADKVPELVRERQIRLRRPAKVSEVLSSSGLPVPQSSHMIKPTITFVDVAAEYFIFPLINRFWVFLRDEQTREARTAHQGQLHRYRSTGTGLILNAMVLSHFLATLAVLVHAARNAKEWLAVVAPDSLELAVTTGTRKLSQQDDGGEDEDDGSESSKGKEAAVLTTSLEVALVVLDGCVDLDGGRSISLEHTAMVLSVGEWAGEVLSQLEKGAKVIGGGGKQETQLRRAAAGVVIKVDEVTSRWRRSMIDAL